MKLHRTFQPNMIALHLAAVVDVMFVLLLYFVLSSSFVLQPGIAVSAPFSPFMMGPQPKARIVTITGEELPSIYYRDRRVTVSELEELLTQEPETDRSLVIKADRHTSYDLVMAVSNHAIGLGYSVVLATSPEQP